MNGIRKLRRSSLERPCDRSVLPSATRGPSCKNLSKDQLFEVKRAHFSRHLGITEDQNNFLHEHSRGTESLKEPSIQGILVHFSAERRCPLDPQRFVCNGVDRPHFTGHDDEPYKKVPMANAKGKNRVSVRWCDVKKGDSNTMAV